MLIYTILKRDLLMTDYFENLPAINLNDIILFEPIEFEPLEIEFEPLLLDLILK